MKKQKRSSAKAPARRAKGRRRTRAVQSGLSLSTPVPQSKLHAMKIGDLYRPLKKPITVRIDADVLAWFKKDGRQYQTRINKALRSVMERELKKA
jgi:uncharacterized protein (DUF4415 family)